MSKSKFYRGCACSRGPRNVFGIPSELILRVDYEQGHQYDFTCVVCGVTAPQCEGGSMWDGVASAEHRDSHAGVCTKCSAELDDQHGDVSESRALELLYPDNVKFLGGLVLRRSHD